MCAPGGTRTRTRSPRKLHPGRPERLEGERDGNGSTVNGRARERRGRRGAATRRSPPARSISSSRAAAAETAARRLPDDEDRLIAGHVAVATTAAERPAGPAVALRTTCGWSRRRAGQFLNLAGGELRRLELSRP